MTNGTGTARFVVVGGGITGAFIAYFLARFGADTTLVERDEIGAHASGSNPGGLNPLHGAGIPGPMQEVALEAFRIHLEHWDSVRRLSEIDFSPRRAARLHLAVDEQDVAQLERAKEPYDANAGFAARWLERKELVEIEPALDLTVRRGLLTEGNAKVDAAAYTRAVAQSAVKLGATVLRAEVEGLRHRGRRVTDVLLDSGSLSCDGVAIASGAWCAAPARWLDISIPVEPVRGEMLLVNAQRPVRTDLAWRDAAAYGTGGAQVWLGGTEDRVGLDPVPSREGRASIVERVARVLPAMRQANVLSHVAALRPVTPDGIPIVGMADGWDNACLAVGSGRKGMLLSAAIGRATAELLTAGSTQVPIDPCSPERCSTLSASAA
jgi:glycine oxidase